MDNLFMLYAMIGLTIGIINMLLIISPYVYKTSESLTAVEAALIATDEITISEPLYLSYYFIGF